MGTNVWNAWFRRTPSRSNPNFGPLRRRFGLGDSERCIEIPWAMSCYNGEHTVLDIGYAHAEDRYMSALSALRVPELFGIDKVGKRVENMKTVTGDIRSTPFRDNTFDFIFCISTIEHIGKDNSIYYAAEERLSDDGDIAAIREIRRVLKQGGKAVITVPYGKSVDYQWFKQYDGQGWDRLKQASGLQAIYEDYYIYRNGWRGCRSDELKHTEYKGNRAPAAAGLVCVLLEKGQGTAEGRGWI